MLEQPGTYALPFARAPYPCLIWNTGGGWSEDQRSDLVQAILDTDARYAVCGGVDCEQWHDDLDQAFIQRYLGDEAAQNEHFLMTTWHTAESPEEVAFYFVHNTDFDHHEFKRLLLVVLGADSAVAERLQGALALAEQDPERFVDEHPEPAG